MKNQLNVGVIGCGKISDAYFTGCRSFSNLRVVSCADLSMAAARAKADLFDIPKVCSVEELLADGEVDIVVNLTIPQAHAGLNLLAVKAGKHVFCEKPFALTAEEGSAILAAAKEHGSLTACAPDTFLGAAQQTCRRAIDDGLIGEPIGASAFMVSHGPEDWHPNPEFFYKAGGGPMFDMGPYYMAALINLIGPIRRVSGSTRVTFPTREVGSEPKRGQIIEVETPTHLTGAMDFASGAVGTVIMSFDVWASRLPRIEIYGSEGTLSVPDPNMTAGEVHFQRRRQKNWEPVPLKFSTGNPSRGIGVADLASAVLNGREPRTDGLMANHIVEVMGAFEKSSTEERHVHLSTTCERPTALPLGMQAGEID